MEVGHARRRRGEARDHHAAGVELQGQEMRMRGYSFRIVPLDKALNPYRLE